MPERAPIATLTFEETGGRMVVGFTFSGAEPIGPIELGGGKAIEEACTRAGRYLKAFVKQVPLPAQSEAELREAFSDLMNNGIQLALRLVGGSADTLREVRAAFGQSWSAWSRPVRSDIPVVQIIAQTPQAATFPIELLPLFGSLDLPATIGNAAVLDELACRFLGFTAVVRRITPGFSAESEVLANRPALPLQLIRFVDPQRPRVFRRRSTPTGFEEEQGFLLSLAARGRVSLDGPWPGSDVPAAGVAEDLAAALYDPERGLRASTRPAGPVQLVHFSCHCETEDRDDDDFELELSTESGESRFVRLSELRMGYAREAIRAAGPTSRAPIILNACEGSRVDPWSTLSFQDHFLANRHRSFLSTQIAIDDEVAAEYGELLYRFLVGGFTFGEAIMLSRRQLLRDIKCPLGILYTHYGSDRLRVEESHPDELPDDQFLEPPDRRR